MTALSLAQQRSGGWLALHGPSNMKRHYYVPGRAAALCWRYEVEIPIWAEMRFDDVPNDDPQNCRRCAQRAQRRATSGAVRA